MNNRGQVGAIGAIFLFIFFIIIWFVWLAGWVAEVGEYAVTSNGLTGIEAFFFSNLNLVIFVCMILGMMGFVYLATPQQ